MSLVDPSTLCSPRELLRNRGCVTIGADARDWQTAYTQRIGSLQEHFQLQHRPSVCSEISLTTVPICIYNTTHMCINDTKEIQVEQQTTQCEHDVYGLQFSLAAPQGLSKDPGLAIRLPCGLGVRALANFCNRKWLKSGANPGSQCPFLRPPCHPVDGVPPGDLPLAGAEEEHVQS